MLALIISAEKQNNEKLWGGMALDVSTSAGSLPFSIDRGVEVGQEKGEHVASH